MLYIMVDLVYSLSSCVGCTDMFYWEEVIADIAINSPSFCSDKRIKHHSMVVVLNNHDIHVITVIS